VIVFARGLLNHLYTRIYFPGEMLNDSDAWLNAVAAERRHTLIAKPLASPPVLQFDIILQGANETVFFDI
jgi:protocatechuate 3,4-dioxygenase alpha subunit